jgi:hypothetical protein
MIHHAHNIEFENKILHHPSATLRAFFEHREEFASASWFWREARPAVRAAP